MHFWMSAFAGMTVKETDAMKKYPARLIKSLISLMLFLFNSPGFAATCPPILQTDPYSPPPGWSALIRPINEGQPYYFDRAIHSQNPDFHYKQTICEYRSCGSFACPGFMLLSDATYESPKIISTYWLDWPMIDQTLVCTPKDHDPGHCIFE